MGVNSSKQGRKKPLAKHPEIGCNTPITTNAPFSVRLPQALKDQATERAASMNIDLSQFIKDAMEAYLSGTRPRRRRAKHDGIRQKLAEIHATIIRCANEIKQSRAQGADAQHLVQTTILLRDAVSALLLIARSIGPR